MKLLSILRYITLGYTIASIWFQLQSGGVYNMPVVAGLIDNLIVGIGAGLWLAWAIGDNNDKRR